MGRSIIPLGTLIKWGREVLKVAAVGNIEGERYYWLVLEGDSKENRGSVSMIPAVTLEGDYE